MGETIVADIETDNLLDALTLIHMVQIGSEDGDDVQLYGDTEPGLYARLHAEGKLQRAVRPLREGIDRLAAADRIIGHNFLNFDMHAINRSYPGAIREDRVVDTLVAARLADPEERDHSLAAWGRRTGTLKGTFNGPYDVLTEEFILYSEQDIPAGRALWHKVRHVLGWGASYALEHRVAQLIRLQELNGFCFDVEAAKRLDIELRGELAELETQLKVTFPPIERTEEWVPKANNSKLGYRKGEPFTKRWTEHFNPASRKHVAERLIALGWKPAAKAIGASGVPTVDEKVLSDLPYPEAKVLLRRFRLGKMLGQLSDGKQGWLKAVKPTGRIHGRVNPNGACTGRMSHSSPNVAQADKDPRMRALWLPRPGWKLCGCDAEGLEARMLGHYLAKWDKGTFSDRVVNGKKDDRTDVHSANLRALIDAGLLPAVFWDDPKLFKLGRAVAKTFLYALMYGAGDWKLGETLKAVFRDIPTLKAPKVPSKELGIMARRAFAKAMVGMDKLTESVRKRSKERGYLIGLDGRHVVCRSEHSALNTLLQGAGAVVMKKAIVLFHEWALENGYRHGEDFAYCANVHDEVQKECRPDCAEHIGKLFARSILEAGVDLGVRCPLAGAYEIGNNWADTH